MDCCKKEYNCGCGCGKGSSFENPCQHCNKYILISNEKCEEATIISQEANEAASCAASLEEQAVQLQQQANKLMCEAEKYWNRYYNLTNESSALLREAQIALEKGIECQKKCAGGGMSSNPCKPISCHCDHKPCYPDCKPAPCHCDPKPCYSDCKPTCKKCFSC